jgi:hypothetical protein
MIITLRFLTPWNKPKKKYEFRFEKSWIKEEDFLAKVDRSWQQDVRANNNLDRLQKQLKNVKNSLRGWGYNLRGRNKKRKIRNISRSC